jgi:Fe(3+) dicitrate transport protein
LNKTERDLFSTEKYYYCKINLSNSKFSVTPGVLNISPEAEDLAFEVPGRCPLENKPLVSATNRLELEWNVKLKTTIMQSITQAYRPVLFSDITPPAVSVSDPNLKMLADITLI